MIGSKDRCNDNSALGCLLSSAGIITQDLIRDHLKVSRNASIPLGRVLCMGGHATEAQINAALILQQLVRRGRMQLQIAVRALRISHTSRISVERALELTQSSEPMMSVASNQPVVPKCTGNGFVIASSGSAPAPAIGPEIERASAHPQKQYAQTDLIIFSFEL